MHTPPQSLLDLPQLRLHALASGRPVDQEFALAGLAADEGKAQEVEGLRFSEPAPLAIGRQLFGDGGRRQVKNTGNALVTGIGGIPYGRNWSSSVVMILTPNA